MVVHQARFEYSEQSSKGDNDGNDGGSGSGGDSGNDGSSGNDVTVAIIIMPWIQVGNKKNKITCPI